MKGAVFSQVVGQLGQCGFFGSRIEQAGQEQTETRSESSTGAVWFLLPQTGGTPALATSSLFAQPGSQEAAVY